MAHETGIVHATCVAIGPHGVLIRGSSGAGKSDLALRLIHAPANGAFHSGELQNARTTLVSDDQVLLTVRDATLWAHAAPNLAGKLEVRGIGIVDLPHTASVPVRLVVDATDGSDVPRMPDPDQATIFLGRNIPTVALALREASTVAKVTLALRRVL